MLKPACIEKAGNSFHLRAFGGEPSLKSLQISCNAEGLDFLRDGSAVYRWCVLESILVWSGKVAQLPNLIPEFDTW